MPETAKLIGAAGSGKTHELLSIMDKVISSGIDPREIGFVSFTRAARKEASGRAADKFGCKVEDLEQHGWFRTLHSTANRCLGGNKGELITGNKGDRTWLEEIFQESMGEVKMSEDDEIIPDSGFSWDSPARVSLWLWGTARQTLSPFEEVWRNAHAIDHRVPELERCSELIKRYEIAKNASGRRDFTDLLSRFAGVRFELTGPEDAYAFGDVPNIPVWIGDEMQDLSALMAKVMRRLTSTCRWVYIGGDPFQSVFGFSGCYPNHFLDWPAQKTRQMPKSYRCPADILAQGERILSRCSNYWDRKVAPADHDGEVRRALLTNVLRTLNPSDDWLLLARTNMEANAMGRRLDKMSIPWKPTKGSGQWSAPVRNAAFKTLNDLTDGAPVDGEQWRCVLKYLPAEQWLVRGTKARFDEFSAEATEKNLVERFPWLQVNDLAEVGATPALIDCIRAGNWQEIIPEAVAWKKAVEQWGTEAVNDPKIRIGTIHSGKGMEAENVALCTTITHQVKKSQETTEGFDEERRVEYVGATRAKKLLVIANDSQKWLRMDIP
jgi:DNA helicase-2/ATP-dependent DNA helicase PcrA